MRLYHSTETFTMSLEDYDEQARKEQEELDRKRDREIQREIQRNAIMIKPEPPSAGRIGGIEI